MKLLAPIVVLAALVTGLYGVAGPMREYGDVHAAWMAAFPMAARSDMPPGFEEAVDRMGSRRDELRGRCQALVFVSGGLALAGLVLAFLARRRQKTGLTTATVVLAVAALAPPIILLTADVF